MLKIRRSHDLLIFNTGIPILVRRYLYIETGPCILNGVRVPKLVSPVSLISTLPSIVTPLVTCRISSQIAKFMGPTWGPPGSCCPQVGSMLAPWTLLSWIYPRMMGVVTPVKCGRDLKHLTYDIIRPEISVKEKSANGAMASPISGLGNLNQ